jgi:hypothetical protein
MISTLMPTIHFALAAFCATTYWLASLGFVGLPIALAIKRYTG